MAIGVVVALVVVVPALIDVLDDNESPAPAPEDSTEPVVVFSELLGSEARALEAVFAPFEARTGIDVRLISSGSFETDLERTVDLGFPPDIALFPQPGFMEELAEEGRVKPLGPLAAEALAANYDPAVASLGELDGTTYGVIVRAVVKSLVWYPPAAFEEDGYEVPATWDELVGLADTIEQAGTSPWCLAVRDFDASGWVATDWVEDLVLRFSGVEVYDQWVDDEVPFTDVRIALPTARFAAIGTDPRQVHGGSGFVLGTYVWDAVDPMLRSPTDCYLLRQGDAQAAHLPGGTRVAPDGDLWVFPFPAREPGPPPMLLGGQLAAPFDERPEVDQTLAYLASPEAGQIWADRAEFVAPYATWDTAGDSALVTYARQLVDEAPVVRFDASDLMPLRVSRAFWAGMVDILGGARLDTVLAEIQQAWEPPPRDLITAP